MLKIKKWLYCLALGASLISLNACGSGVSVPSNYQSNNVAITGGSINNTSVNATGYSLNGKTLISPTAPTTADANWTISNANGTGGFLITAGIGAVSPVNIVMPSGFTLGWNCTAVAHFSGLIPSIKISGSSTIQLYTNTVSLTTGQLVNSIAASGTYIVTCMGGA